MRQMSCTTFFTNAGSQMFRSNIINLTYTSLQVAYYWCHREPWQLLALRGQRVHDAVTRHAAGPKARPGVEGDNGTQGSHNSKPECRIAMTSPQDRRDSEMATKPWYARSSHSSVINESFFPHLASTGLFWRQREQKTVSDPRLTSRVVHAIDYLSSLSDCYTHKHIKFLSFQNKHDTIPVNKENLK